MELAGLNCIDMNNGSDSGINLVRHHFVLELLASVFDETYVFDGLANLTPKINRYFVKD